jgi:hypothetical protein
MGGQRFWVHNGELEPQRLNSPVQSSNDDEFFKQGRVRLTTGDLGSEVKWYVNSPCIRSLFKAIQWLPSSKPPYILRFHAVGWFEEAYRNVSVAIDRIEQVLARGDRHFASRVFIQEARSGQSAMPDVLKLALSGKSVPEEYSVDCTFDERNSLFRVDRVGSKSAIGRVWGTYTSSHPCQSAGSYGDPVNATYQDVLKSNRPRYDHVLAALRLPDNALHWVPYHRIVLPRSTSKGEAGVAVISQIARVDIKVL